MESDVKLIGEEVILQGSETSLNNESADSSVALNLKNKTGYWHLSGPRTYDAGNPFSIFWRGTDMQWRGPFLRINTSGNVGIGVGSEATPARPLHVEGGEIHSGGKQGGLSFSDRKIGSFVEKPGKGERWVWYANGRTARLWSGNDILTVGSTGLVGINGSLAVMVPRTDAQQAAPPKEAGGDGGGTSPKFGGAFSTQDAKIDLGNVLRGSATDLEIKINPTMFFIPAIKVDQKTGSVGINNYAPAAEFALDVGGDVRIQGNVKAAKVSNLSSKTLKENVSDLSAQEALAALTELNPVKFNFKQDVTKENHVGFIAEDVPELVAAPDRKTLSAMDIVAVLTKVVQEQSRQISDLTDELKNLKNSQAFA